MEFLIILIFIVGAILLVRKKSKAKTSDKSFKKDQLDTKDLHQNMPTQKSLSTDQLQRIKIIQESISEVNSTSLEETIENFRKDTNPENEIIIWEAIVGTYQKILQQNNNYSLPEKQEIYNLLLMRSMMSSEEVIDQITLTTISESKAIELLSLYSMDAKPIIVVR